MVSELLPPKIVEYCWIDTNSKKFIENAQQSYQKISAPTWPKVETIEDLMNLPNSIKQECKTHAFNPWMYLSENIDYQEWQNYTGGEITPDYLARFKYMLQDNIEYIKDQTIVDLAGNSGAESFCCMKLGAKSVTLAEARSELVDKAKNIAQLENLNVNCVVHDINQLLWTEKLCQVDTVLFLGIIYHLDNHKDVLMAITNAQPKCIIIDTIVTDHYYNDQPEIKWVEEKTDSIINAYSDSEDVKTVGQPNEAWIRLNMLELGYIEKRAKEYEKEGFFRKTYTYIKGEK